MKAWPQLIFIVTHRCNLNCQPCPVIKSREDLSLGTARKALSCYLRLNQPTNLQIKFSGGEPLLVFPVIKRIVRMAGLKKKSCSFTFSTNGALLDKKTIAYLSRHPEIEVWYSPHHGSGARMMPAAARLANIGINILISPGNVHRLADDFLKYVHAGFKKFNFLPAYFSLWKKGPLEILGHEFDVLAGLINGLQKSGRRFIIKNVSATGSTPLFNDGFVVDCNGDVFGNNLILSKRFAHLKDALKAGNVGRPEDIQRTAKKDFAGVLRKNLDKKIYASTRRVDDALTRFVLLLAQGRYGKN